MVLKTRIGRLESRLGPPPLGRCRSCGVPQGWRAMWDAVGDDGASAMPACAICGHALDESGRPLLALPPGRGQKQLGANADRRV